MKPKMPPTEKAISNPKVSDFVDKSEGEDDGEEGGTDCDDEELEISDNGNDSG